MRLARHVKRNENRCKQLIIRVTASEHEQISDIAYEHELSLTAFLQKAINLYLVHLKEDCRI